jgi:hypothetical protein
VSRKINISGGSKESPFYFNQKLEDCHFSKLTMKSTNKNSFSSVKESKVDLHNKDTGVLRVPRGK